MNANARPSFMSQHPVIRSISLAIGVMLLLSCHGPKSYLSSDQAPLLSYSKSMCFGPCPAFSLEVDRNGHVAYVGRANVDPIGRHTGKWSEQDLMKLAETAAALRLDQKAGTYDNPLITDLPSIRLSFGGHEIFDRINGPDIKAIYTQLDSLIAATAWTPSKPSSGDKHR